MLPEENVSSLTQTPPPPINTPPPPSGIKVRIGLILGGILLLVIIISAVLVSLGNRKNAPVQKRAGVAPDLLQEYSLKSGIYYSSAISPALKNPPQVHFKYTSTAPAPHVVATAPGFKLIHDISEVEAQDLAKKFGIGQKPTLIGLGNFHFFDQDKKLDLVVYRKSGACVVTFLGNFTEATPSAGLVKINSDADAISQAQDFLKGLNLWEESFTLAMSDQPYPKNSVVYKRHSQPDNYFVEFHRGWKVLPILNQIGLLNSSLKDQLVDPRKYLAADGDINYASDGLVSFKRPDQFNSVTVGLNKSGHITYLQYYLRRISDQSQVSIKPFEQALGELKAGNGLGILVYPVAQQAGSNNEADYTQDQWQQLFQSNGAVSDEAVIDDAQLAYEEKLITEPQSIMIPVYLFRGRAPLKGGVVVNFVALVDARGQ